MQMICLAGILEKIAFEIQEIDEEKIVRTVKKRQLEDEQEERGRAIQRIAMEGMTTQKRASALVSGRVLDDLLTPSVHRQNNWHNKRRLRRDQQGGIVRENSARSMKMDTSSQSLLSSIALQPLIPTDNDPSRSTMPTSNFTSTSATTTPMATTFLHGHSVPLFQLPQLFLSLTAKWEELRVSLLEDILKTTQEHSHKLDSTLLLLNRILEHHPTNSSTSTPSL